MKYFFPILMMTTLIISCSKEGTTGPQGDAGIQGQQGTPGPAGTANVIYSDWLTYDLKSGVYAGVYYAKIDAPKLTQAILDKGDIKLYISAYSNVWPIPFPTMPGFYFSYSLGAIELYSPTDWDSAIGYKIRYILIPGSVHARGSAAIDWNDYGAVKRRYNFPD